MFLPRELGAVGEMSVAFYELLLLWLIVMLAVGWLSGLAGARLSPEEAKELRTLKKGGGLLGGKR